jgi:preprotein translocase subunit SecF
MLLRYLPHNTHIDFVGKRYFAFAVTGILFLVTAISLTTHGLNLAIDFAGGILIESKASQDIDVGELRNRLNKLELGGVELQQFGGPREILIRVQQQHGGEAANRTAIAKVKETLGDGWEYRRVEQVGPKVGDELLQSGVLATVLAILAIAVYVAFRFEWQFGIAALVATGHDVFCTMILFTVFRLEFDLTAVAALLTLAGYSINDTVVVFDRIRELMRRNRTMDMKTLVNLAVNQTLTRTILTSGTTMIAILPMLIFGGSALFTFTLAIVFGIVIGTYSSIYVAGSLLLYMTPVRKLRAEDEAPATTAG